MSTQRLLLTDLHIFDGHASNLTDAQDILIEAGRIREIGANLRAEGARVLRGTGRFAIPGLIDAHFHANAPLLDIEMADRMPHSLLAQHARLSLQGALQRGFTTLRDAGGADRGLAMALEAGLIPGPRLFFAGKALSQTGGHGDLAPLGAPACACAYSGTLTEVVDGVDAVRLAVRKALRDGASQIKLMVSGGVLSESDPIWSNQFSDEEIAAAVAETGARRAYVMAHAHGADAAARCARLGVRSVEHGTLIDAPTAVELAAAGTYVVPTLGIIDALRSLPVGAVQSRVLDKLALVGDQARAAVAVCRDAGVRLGLGTDLLGELQTRQSREFLMRAEIQPALDVLKSATSINAEMMMMEGELGEVSVGALADILVLNRNPLENVRVLADPDATIDAIICRGQIVKGDQ